MTTKRNKCRSIAVHSIDHKRLKVLSVNTELSIKDLVSKIIDSHKELEMIKKAG